MSGLRVSSDESGDTSEPERRSRVNKTDKTRRNSFCFFSHLRDPEGTGGSQDPLGWMPCGLLAVLHLYARNLGLRSNRQMSAKSPCPGVGGRTLVR